MNITKWILLLILISTSILAQNTKNDTVHASKPFILGQVVTIKSKILHEDRVLNIYLPEGYNSADTAKYPVIYLLDGAADEDFIHIVGLVQFHSFEWINKVPKSIVVGIANIDRKRDFTFPTFISEDKVKFPSSGHSDQFISFIEKELQPFIEQSFHTNLKKTIIGQSLAGLLATEILITKPFLFNNYIIVSPSIWWNNASILDQSGPIFQADFNQQIQIYLAVGKEGLTPTRIPRVMEVDVNLLNEKISAVANKNVNLFFDFLPDKDHATILHQAVSNAFAVLFSSNNHKD